MFLLFQTSSPVQRSGCEHHILESHDDGSLSVQESELATDLVPSHFFCENKSSPITLRVFHIHAKRGKMHRRQFHLIHCAQRIKIAFEPAAASAVANPLTA